MKISKKVKITIGSLFGIVVLLFIVLVIHIATAKPVSYDNATIQVSRIDFKAPVNSAQAIEITNNLKSIPGVTSDNLIIKNNVVVYFHDNRITNSKKVYEALMEKGHYEAKPFIVPAALASAEVCPVMDQNSFSYKFSRGVQHIFN
jgi:hypothetical protein